MPATAGHCTDGLGAALRGAGVTEETRQPFLCPDWLTSPTSSSTKARPPGLILVLLRGGPPPTPP